MNSYESEQEQLEALQKWWKENGRAVILGVALGAAAIIGWSSWQAYTTGQAEDASVQYDRLSASAREGAREKVMEQGGALFEDFPSGGYTTLTALTTAKAAFQQNDKDKAKAYLQSVIDHGDSEAVQRIARLRLARILMAEKKWNDAMGLLDTNAGEFAGLYEEMLGDIFLAQGDSEKARVAYERSLTGNTLPNNGRFQSRVRTKLDDLGSTPEQRLEHEAE